ncbi:thiamine pyrophosphate-binding protein [Bacillus salipaludis]|uniref:thiamine pyrophosphate-binding protein n=1 Tax=Bacillus salipaludis TaxID=2547811 RepID=UPI002E22264B|nr:thiamine pyrophosphate-binding protein [Bacillus salipaludis]
MHVGNKLVDLLTQMNVNTVFGLPGGQTLPYYDAIKSSDGKIRHISMRAEKSAAYAAVAYSRLTNKVGVCDATVGPGAAEFTSGLGEAYNSSTPIFALFSDLPLDWEHLRDHGNASQGFDQLEMVKPFTKWAARVTSAKALPDMVRNAFLKSTSGRPGPTVLSIHEDIFKQEWQGGAVPVLPTNLGVFPRYRPCAEKKMIEKALSILTGAKKPVMIVGGGAMLSKAEQEITAFAEFFSIPVLQTFTGRGIIADEHPLAVGLTGGLGTLSSKKLAEEADVVFLIGFKSGQNSTFTWTIPSVQQTVIHLDLDEAEIGRVFHAEVGLVGDVKQTMEEMLRLAVTTLEKPNNMERLTWIRAAKKDWEDFVCEELQNSGGRLKPQEVMAAINRVSNPEDVLVCDASFASGWGGIYFKHKEAGRKLITPRGLAGLGFGLPAAIGAAAALEQGEVYLLAGDGGFGYAIGELATLQAYGFKVTIVVLDNRNWGWMEWLNKLNYQKEYFDLPEINFVKVAEGFGLGGYRARNGNELLEGLIEAKKSPISSVIHVDSSLWETPVIGFREADAKEKKTPVKYM